MARGRYDRLGIIDGNKYETFQLEQTNWIKEPDTFNGIKTFTYTTKTGDRLDHLAARFLNEDRYYWVIALINNLMMPFVPVGTKLNIPVDVNDVLDRI